MNHKKLTIPQIVTIALLVMYVIWERNIQLYLKEHILDNSYATRKDLIVIIPVLLVMIIISLRQWFKKKKE